MLSYDLFKKKIMISDIYNILMISDIYNILKSRKCLQLEYKIKQDAKFLLKILLKTDQVKCKSILKNRRF